MIRHIAANLACLLLAAVLVFALQFPLAAYAQNAGEAPSPEPGQDSTSEEEKSDDQQPAGGENNPDKQAEPVPPDEDTATGDSTDTAGDSADDEAESPDGEEDDTAEGDEPAGEPADSGSTETAGEAGEAGNIAEGSSADSGDEAGQDSGEEDEDSAEAGEPVGPQLPDTEGTAEQQQPAPQGPTLPPATPRDEPAGEPATQQPNAVDSRPAGTSLANTAESGVDEQGIAIPPDPDLILPNIPPPPADVAGSVEDYEEPGISLEVPGLEEVPTGNNPDAYFQPERGYLEDRPLPPLDVDETEEERISRNIEESLRLIDLAAEERPTAGIQIPLPSGVVTFKASDS
ncbi:MAG TPA: hypothetical protein ENO21_03525, partial [Firmicutes bacterium]|nr:hypothetical protein [Bacillota bacterium]